LNAQLFRTLYTYAAHLSSAPSSCVFVCAA
jgi:hypothetical protein